MWYYYGNDYKEAYSNDPVKIESAEILKQYEENYNVVIPMEKVSDEAEILELI